LAAAAKGYHLAREVSPYEGSGFGEIGQRWRTSSPGLGGWGVAPSSAHRSHL